MRALSTTPARNSAVTDPQLLVTLEVLLQEELDAQRAIIADATADIGELTGSDGDSAHERDIAERALNHALGVIAEIEHALERINTTTYGACEICGAAIPPARLQAIPYARSCVHCPPPPPLPRLD